MRIITRVIKIILSSTAGFAAATNRTLIVPPASTNAAAPAAGTDIRPIKEAVPLPDYLFWALVFAGIIAGIAAAILLWRWWLRRTIRAPESILIPPHRRAMQELKSAWCLIDDPEPFCTTVSNIIRVYLEARYMLKAPERTTEEFLSELQQSSSLQARHKELLGDFLTRCDLVKFARHEPTRPELENLFSSAMRLVEETSPAADIAEKTGASVEGAK